MLSQGRNSSTRYTKILNLPKNLLYYLKIVLYSLKTEIYKYSYIYLFRKKHTATSQKNQQSLFTCEVVLFCHILSYFLYTQLAFFMLMKIFISCMTILSLFVLFFFRKILIPFTSIFSKLFLVFFIVFGWRIFRHFYEWEKIFL